MPSQREGRPDEAYPRLEGRFLRKITDDPASLEELEELEEAFGQFARLQQCPFGDVAQDLAV
jgi:hypothetical protein